MGTEKSQEERIRIRAYEIWLAEGKPEGRHKQHWEQAELELKETAASKGPPLAGPYEGFA